MADTGIKKKEEKKKIDLQDMHAFFFPYVLTVHH